MNRKPLLLCSIILLASLQSHTQSLKVFGTIMNANLEPLAFATVEVKGFKQGSISKENGYYELELEPGKFDLLISMLGYKTQTVSVIIRKESLKQDIILEAADATTLSAVTIKGKLKDRAEEYIRNVIRNKEAIEAAAGNYSCNVYIKALQEDSVALKKAKKIKPADSLKQILESNELNRMAMAEVVLQLDRGEGKKIKEERTGVSKRGNEQSLFYLSTMEGDFSIYHNNINARTISPTPFVSPVSYSGLLAYRFKVIKTETINGLKQYTISIKPRQLSNATVEGEITIADSSWVVLHTRLQFPKYHLAEYDFFEVEQQYEFVDQKAWMVTRQSFIYNAVADKRKSSGRTVVTYRNFELNKRFPKNYFGVELSSASQQAYEQDSNFWKSNRAEALTAKELRFIHFKDSIYQATHSKAYLDSVDRVINKFRWQNIAFKGQTLNNHEKRREMRFPSVPELFQPFQLGGLRIQPSFMYNKTWESRKNLTLFADLSYGIRNKDLNGNIRLNRMYNPFNRGFYGITLQKDFAYIFSGDAWINMIQRSNIYLNQGIGLKHGLEIANGLYVFSDVDLAFRRSVSNIKTDSKIDSLFPDILDNNQVTEFESHNAVYGELRVEYTFRQRYVREPKEKIILGSSWPTVYVQWRKGLPGIMKSVVDFDYLEFGLKQTVKLGTMGTSGYTLKTGSFLSRKDLRLVDYKYQRRGDPLLMLNPSEAFQSLDSTFPVFNRFVEGHYVHEFNGAFLNKIPFFKKIGLREVAGAGFLIAKERNLRYAELFTGVERVFKYPFNLLGKFKVGFYVVGSVANQFRNPVQFKFGITAWDRKRGKWF